MSNDNGNGNGNGKVPPRPRSKGIAGRVVDAVVAPIVNPVVSAIDVPDVVDRIDVAELVDRIDVDHLVARVDIDALVARVDLNTLLGKVDINAMLDRVDTNRMLDSVDIDRMLSRVDIDAMLDRVDIDKMLDRVDVDRMLSRVDIDKMLERVDMDKMLDRVDLDKLMNRIDVNAIVKRTELGAIIARSTTGVFGQLLDMARAVGTTIDVIVQGACAKISLRGKEQRPGRPGAPDDVVDVRRMSIGERGVALQGHYAGSVSRFFAFMIDQFLIGTIYVWGAKLIASAVEVITGTTYESFQNKWLSIITYLIWAFLYLSVPLAVSGRTIGKAILGLQVVRADGTPLDWGPAALRTFVFPFSFLFFGAGLLIGLFRRDRRELQDLVASTAVIYAWDAELARLRASGAEVAV